LIKFIYVYSVLFVNTGVFIIIDLKGDITKAEGARIKEIHHIVKNNLQVISSLISLQTEKLQDTECINTLKEIQGRITSIAFVHDELYSSPDLVTLDFSSYLAKMINYLLDFYKPKNKKISLKLNVEKILVGMDTAIPLGIIVNELLSNAVNYAFPNDIGGEITISLYGTGNHEDIGTISKCQGKTHYQYVLIIHDNGIGLPNEIEFESSDSLGFQIVNLLVDQIDGCIEREKSDGTKFCIWFNNIKS
jgi:two-component sensor histidine kinase